MNELVKIPFGEANRVGLTIPAGVSEQDWKTIGHNLCRCKDSLNFWIGDWLNYGNAAYGQKYSTAIDVFKDEGSAGYGLEEKTLRNYASVANRVQMSLRRDKLSFTHHAIIADNFTDDKDKDVWLAKAVMNKWSTADLVREIRGKQKNKATTATNDERGFMFDGWVSDWKRGLSLFPIENWSDQELENRYAKLAEIECDVIAEAERRNLPLKQRALEV